MSYKSQFTGAEADRAIAGVLGNDYDNDASPGCKQIGLTQDLRQDLNQVTIPGLYTVFFYYNGPEELETINPSPIRMRVYWEGIKEMQWILYHTDVYFRDIQTTTKWTKVQLAAKEIEIIDNLMSDKVTAALSANMGRYLKMYIDNRIIGGPNLLVNSAFNNPYNPHNGWMWTDEDNKGSYVDLSNEGKINNQFKPIVNRAVIFSNDSAQPAYLTTDPSHMPVAMGTGTVYTASVYIDSIEAQMKHITKGSYVDVILQISVLNSSNDGYIEQSNPTVMHVYESDLQAGPVRIVNTFTRKVNTPGKLYVSIGIITAGKIMIYSPKLEFGHYATAWTQNYADQYNEFINATRFHDINIESPAFRPPIQQTGYRYDTKRKQFVLDELTVGGGGGFVVGNTEPAESQCLWFNTNDYDGYLHYKHPTRGWIRIPIMSILRWSEPPSDTSKWWLDPSTEDDVVAASLKYYDHARKIWRLPVTAPTKCYEIRDTPPENNGLIWIHSDTHIPRVYDSTSGEWIIIHAAWGENRTE